MMAGLPVYLGLVLLFALSTALAEANESRRVYLVSMKGGSSGRFSTSFGHQEVLSQVLDEDSTVSEALIYSYRESFTGFAARLTPDERQKLERREDVLGVSPSKNLEIQTTRSWDFLKFPVNVKRQRTESDLIVGILDSGIWPNSTIFRDDGLGPPPSKWKGECHNITCNNKIIGAKSYYSGNITNLAEEYSVVDTKGHGTHMASIVAGMETEETSFFGLAKGTVRGGVPNARIAVYKVCWKIREEGKIPCPEHDILQAIEDAMSDGVDVISASLGFNTTIPLKEDFLAIGALRAFKKGILSSAPAGNFGPDTFTVTNGAPWIFTVAASHTDRRFETLLELRGGDTIIGNAINPFDSQDAFFPLVNITKDNPSAALSRELAKNQNGFYLFNDPNNKGKDVIIDYDVLDSIGEVNQASEDEAEGLIVTFDSAEDKACRFPLAAVCLTREQETTVKEYMKTEGDHLAKIHKTTDRIIKNISTANSTVANFSSKGPNAVFANVLKPDISAPGVDILAGWSEKAKLIPDYPNDNRSLEYNIESGTSMACPHVTAAALYLKSYYPSWSPAAIKSALMTTATPMAKSKDPCKEFSYGAGNLNPQAALDPGLVYDVQESDYVDFLCQQGYDEKFISWLLDDNSTNCLDASLNNQTELNYPTMSKLVDLNKYEVVFHRTVTNVGPVDSKYTARIGHPKRVSVSVEPSTLVFDSSIQKLNFTVTVTGQLRSPIFATSITWSDGKHEVRSPIVIYYITKEQNACGLT